MRRPGPLLPVLAVVVGAALLGTAGLYGAAIASLGADGPNPAGYDLLLTANRAVLADAVLLSLAGVVLAAHRMRSVPGVLLAAAAVTLTAAAGAQALGAALANTRPLDQPIDLNSLLLAVQGSGATIMPAPIVLTVAALTAVSVSRIAGRRVARTAPTSS